MSKKTTAFLTILLLCTSLFASKISFEGGKTLITNGKGGKIITLTGSAHAETEEISLVADSLSIYGNEYCYVECNGNVCVKEGSLTLTCPTMFYDRTEEVLTSDGWIEIDDTEHEVSMSGAFLQYSRNDSKMKLQINATIRKATESGVMKCSADSIEYDTETQILILKGYSNVSWGNDNYNAAMIVVDLNTEEIELYGSISGEVNG